MPRTQELPQALQTPHKNLRLRMESEIRTADEEENSVLLLRQKTEKQRQQEEQARREWEEWERWRKARA